MFPYAVFSLLVLGQWDAGNPFIRGDANMDGRVNVVDAIATIRFLYQGADLGDIQGREPTCNDATDANDDGRVNFADPVFLLQFLFLRGSPPPLPFPGKEKDPTVDQLGC